MFYLIVSDFVEPLDLCLGDEISVFLFCFFKAGAAGWLRDVAGSQLRGVYLCLLELDSVPFQWLHNLHFQSLHLKGKFTQAVRRGYNVLGTDRAG